MQLGSSSTSGEGGLMQLALSRAADAYVQRPRLAADENGTALDWARADGKDCRVSVFSLKKIM